MKHFTSLIKGHCHDRTIISLPSISIDPKTLENIVGITHYETRMVWEILKANKSNTKVLFLTSLPIESEICQYMFDMFPKSDQIKKRVKFLNISHNSKDNLTSNILDCGKTIQAIKNYIQDGEAYINPFLCSPAEIDLANKLDLPVFGADPKYSQLTTKTGNKEIFQMAKVNIPLGSSNIFQIDQLIKTILKLINERPTLKKLMVKLNDGVSGDGNALLDINALKSTTSSAILNRLEKMTFFSESMSWQKFSSSMARDGGIVEEFLDGPNKSSPSCQCIIYPDKTFEILSTHEQLLDRTGQRFQGACFPAKRQHRNQLQIETAKVAKVLIEKGVIGPFSVDFLCVAKKLYAIEINLRQGGTTHPYQFAKLLTDSTYDETKGLLQTKQGGSIFYLSNDNYVDKSLKTIGVKELIEKMKQKGLLYNHIDKKGVVFYLLSAMKDYGKLGHMVIGHSRNEVNALNLRCKIALEQIAKSKVKNKAS